MKPPHPRQRLFSTDARPLRTPTLLPPYEARAPDRLLCIELDGSQHGGEYDRKRDEFIRKCGLDVLRIPNGEAATHPIETLTDAVTVPMVKFGSVLARANYQRAVALR